MVHSPTRLRTWSALASAALLGFLPERPAEVVDDQKCTQSDLPEAAPELHGPLLDEPQAPVLLLQTSFEASLNTRTQGDPMTYLQALISQRAAEEALRVAAEHAVQRVLVPLSEVSSDIRVPSVPEPQSNSSVKTAADVSGVTANQEGDLIIFFSSLETNTAIVLLCLFVVSCGRSVFPVLYCHRNTQLSGGFFTWPISSFRLSIDEIWRMSSLDHALLIEFSHLSMKICLVVGIPCLAILSPIYCFCGGNAAGEDHLSWLGFSNVATGSWVCWPVCISVWYVVIVTNWFMFATFNTVFMPRRVEWLESMPRLRAATVLVEFIPDDKNTEQGMKDYFNDFVFGREVVQEVNVVKNDAHLLPLYKERDELLKKSRRKRQDKSAEADRARLKRITAELIVKANEVNADDSLNTTRAFVTFYHRREATVALKLLSPDDEEEIEVTPAPDPMDVLWKGLQEDPTQSFAEELIGYALIIGLFFGFMPLVVSISALTDLDNLSRWIPALGNLMHRHPSLSTTWESLMGSIALTIVMSFLPTALRFILSGTAQVKAYSHMQHLLQVYYYWFQVVFVLLVTAIGSSVWQTSQELIRSPLSIFQLFANTLPMNTHFYLSYLAVQWSSHALGATRYIEVVKYLFFQRIYDQDFAIEISKTEDQDYYGIGGRAARWTLYLVIGLVFSSLCPLMLVIAFVNFLVSRIIYGYLFVFAETRKPDLGGPFFRTMLRQTMWGLAIYVTLMTGVLLHRAATTIPGVICAGAFFPVWYGFHKYHLLRWEVLEFVDVKEYDARLLAGKVPEVDDTPDAPTSYKQPELQVAPPEPPPEVPPRQPLSSLLCGVKRLM